MILLEDLESSSGSFLKEKIEEIKNVKSLFELKDISFDDYNVYLQDIDDEIAMKNIELEIEQKVAAQKTRDVIIQLLKQAAKSL